MATFDVLLPVKNGIAFFTEALDSIVQQTFTDWRLLILDHGSTDGSIELAQHYAERDRRIELHVLPQAVGLSGLLNAGLSRCDSRYVLRQDADDISLPQRMAVLARAFEIDDSLAVIGSLGTVINAQGQRIGRIDMPVGPQGISAGMLFRTPVCHPAAALRLSSLQRLGACYGEDFLKVLPAERRLQVPGLAEDYFLFGQMALAAPCMNLSQDLIKFRWHGNNISATKYLEQMRVALNISRTLAETLAQIQQRPYVDPAPFCNHAERLFDLGKESGPGIASVSPFAPYSDSDEAYQILRQTLQQWLPASPALQRELAFRQVIATRSKPLMAARFTRYAMQYGARPTETRTVKSWLLHGLKKQPILTLTPSGLCASN